MTEEYLPSQDLKEKFQEWFGDPVPADFPFLAEVDHSIGYPALAEIPFPGEAFHSYYRARRGRVSDLQKLFELFIFGLRGAVSLAAIVGFIILMMYMSDFGWSKYWPSPVVVIFLSAALGFWGGLLRGSIYKLREKYSYKDEI